MAYQQPRLTGDFRESVRTALEKLDNNILELYNSNPGTIEWASLVNSAVPAVDNAIDLGAADKQWRSLYVSSGAFYLGGTAIGIDELGNLTVNGDSISSTINYVDIVGTPDLSGYATTSSVSSAISSAVSNLVDTAPTTLNTLNELAAALGDDAGFATTITTALGNKANTVDLAAVATSGSYNDLADIPDPAAAFDQDLNTTSDVAFNSVTTDTFASTGAGVPEIVSDTTVAIITDAGNTAQTWTFATDGKLTLPGSIEIQGDTTIVTAQLNQLSQDAEAKNIEIFGIQGQIGSLQGEIGFWQFIISIGPSHPQYDEAQSNFIRINSELSSLFVSSGTAQDELLEIQNNIIAANILLSNLSVTLTYNAADEELSINRGGIRFPDNTVQTTAYPGTPNFISSGITAPGSAVVANETDISVNFSDGGSGKFVFKATGELSYANNASQRDTDTVQCLGNASTVVYTSSAQFQHTIKLIVQVEGFEDAAAQYDTQACEIIVAKSFRGNGIASSVYAVVHTSDLPLATFTAVWNALTSRVDVVCTPTATNAVYVRTFATEITTSD